jgi:glutamine synthetase
VHRVAVEALTMVQMASTSLMPAGIAYQKQLADSINAARAAAPKAELGEQEKLLVELSTTVSRLRAATLHLKEAHHQLEQKGDAPAQAVHARDQILPAMLELRGHGDRLESLVDDALWPLPKYHELLFVH